MDSYTIYIAHNILYSLEMASVSEIKRLGEILRDESIPMKARNRSLFGLRAVTNTDLIESAVQEINTAFKDTSALLKHECAYR